MTDGINYIYTNIFVSEISSEEAKYRNLSPYGIAETAAERRRSLEGYFRGRRAGGDELMTASLLKNACPFPKSLRGTWNEDLGGGVILTEIGQHSLSLERDGHQYNALCYGKSPDERIFLISSVHGGKYYSSCLRLKTDFMSRRQFFTKVGSYSQISVLVVCFF
ncbi:hypothetical protein CAPTEDRAFT_202887 [Capitella teleta]|uniref:Uncharacterized protein n=1 Tax=Capitella teleta TaxID=283909 RepID=R7UNS8_CAPTE|nr:hypothetical protein CAPTEDRAFT_202887 [Capitella teleta]|eukprot:ELU08189.1 hypothetical protein CAPTEDRAFT_202887 [Capitella teleta]